MSNRKARTRLFNEQGGKCFYCQKAMILYHGKIHRNTNPDKRESFCTIEHLFHRKDLRRYDPAANIDGKRLVAACYRCNREKGIKDDHVLPPLPTDLGNRKVLTQHFPHITMAKDGTVRREQPVTDAELLKFVRDRLAFGPAYYK